MATPIASKPAGPSKSDRRKVAMLAWMRNKHRGTVNDGTVTNFRHRRIPTTGLPTIVPACSAFPNRSWLPKELVVPDRLPPEGRLPKRYLLKYYGLGKLGWSLYDRNPIDPDVAWDPAFEWNSIFPKTVGWEDPSDDTSFARLRLQGPNPWLLGKTDQVTSAGEPIFAVDYRTRFEGILPPIVARFVVRADELVPLDIEVAGHVHAPGDPTWDRAKRVVNAADIRFVPFGRHLLDVHLIVGQAFALAAYSLPVWHKLRPFMQFFTYGSIEVNHMAYQSLIAPSSYFIASGFMGVDDVARLFGNGVEHFDIDDWIAPRDIERRGLADIPNHPYVEDAGLAWPAFAGVVERHLTERGFDDETIDGDADLQNWYRLLTGLLPNSDPAARPLTRERLVELGTALLWNNVIHEICGDLSPILGSQDPEDKAFTRLDHVRAMIGDGSLTGTAPPATMADVFLMDQASYVSSFNVGGNNILRVNAYREVDDPKLALAIEDLQAELETMTPELIRRNSDRAVRFDRMLPSNWEASISF